MVRYAQQAHRHAGRRARTGPVRRAIHAEGALASAQLGHRVRLPPAPAMALISPSPFFSPLASVAHGPQPGRISRVTADFARAARLIADAGFDAVELHLGSRLPAQ